jgi:hypothetical protein
MSRKWLSGLFLISLLLFISCSTDDGPTSSITITGSGVLITEEREMDDFHSVVMNTVGDIMITQRSSSKCVVTVDDNVAQYMETTVSNGQLMITAQDGVSLRDFDLTVNLNMNDIEILAINGVATIIGQNQFHADEIGLVVNGVGVMDLDLNAGVVNSSGDGVSNMILSGTADRHNHTFSSVTRLDAFDLDTDTTVIIISGDANAEVSVSSLLDVTITGNGRIYYKGNPTINTTITGTGQVIDAN